MPRPSKPLEASDRAASDAFRASAYGTIASMAAPTKLASAPRVGTRRRGAHRWGSRTGKLAAATLALLAFLAATNRYVSTYESVHVLHFSDSLSYRAMANAAPGLLHRRIPEWHAERVAVNWVIGSVTKLLGVPLTVTYFVAVAIVVLTVCMLLADLLLRLGVSSRAGFVCLALFILNPFSLRSDLLSPADVDDLVLVLGVTIAVRGLVLRSPGAVLGGLVLGTVARQTAVPAAVVAAAVVMIDPAWRERMAARRISFATALLLLPAACYLVIRIIAGPFSGPSPSLHTMTLLGAPRSLHALVQHFARCFIVMLGAAALLAVSLWVRRGGRSAPGGAHRLTVDAAAGIYASLGIAAAIIVQPMVLNPTWASYNESRLTSLGLVPLVVALAISLAELERVRGGPISARTTGVLVGLLALGSFHRVYTWLRLTNPSQTVVLQIGIALALAAVMLRSQRARAISEP
jgi:hypothetical protein